MATQQPIWRFIANLGDRNPLISAALVFIDITGVYEPEMILFNEDDKNSEGKYIVSYVTLSRCSMLNANPSTLSDNRFHADKPAWFADRLAEVDKTCCNRSDETAHRLVSNDPMKRARAYLDLISYFGEGEFDHSPDAMTKAEIKRRFRAAFRKNK